MKRYRVFAAILLMMVFIVGTISTMLHFAATTSDLLEIVQDDKNDIEEDPLNFGDSENDETQSLVTYVEYLQPQVGNEFRYGSFLLTIHSLSVITPPPELIQI